MLSGPLVSGTRTYYLVTCLYVLIESISLSIILLFISLAVALLVLYAIMFSYSHG